MDIEQRIELLERLARLRAAGAMDSEEFAIEKAKVWQAEPPSKSVQAEAVTHQGPWGERLIAEQPLHEHEDEHSNDDPSDFVSDLIGRVGLWPLGFVPPILIGVLYLLGFIRSSGLAFLGFATFALVLLTGRFAWVSFSAALGGSERWGRFFSLGWLSVALFVTSVGSCRTSVKLDEQDAQAARVVRAQEDEARRYQEDATEAAKHGVSVSDYRELIDKKWDVYKTCKAFTMAQARWTAEDTREWFAGDPFTWDILDSHRLKVSASDVRLTNGFGGARDVSYYCIYDSRTGRTSEPYIY